MTENELREKCVALTREVGTNWDYSTLRFVADRIFANLKFLLWTPNERPEVKGKGTDR